MYDKLLASVAFLMLWKWQVASWDFRHDNFNGFFFSFSVWLSKNKAYTMKDLMKGFEESFTPPPTAVELTHLFNFSDWVKPYTNDIKNHTKPHVIKITNDEGRAKIVFKKWSSDKVRFTIITYWTKYTSNKFISFAW